MKISEKSKAVKNLFGSFLKDSRLAANRSVYDVGYILGTSHATVWEWERGRSFPCSIVLMKKLCLVYRDVVGTLRSLVAQSGIAPTRKEWYDFETMIFSARVGDPMKAKLKCRYKPKDKRDKIYKLAFGRYLRKSRLDLGIGMTAMASAFGKSTSSLAQWESGTSLPQNVMVLALYDKLFGDTFDVLFGLCRENAIHLDRGEKKEVLTRLEVFEDTKRWDLGKPKPPSWEAYCERRRKAS